MLKIFSSAFVDFEAAVRLRRVWLALATEDISDQHRRTALGPIWLLLNYLTYVLIFAGLLRPHGDVANYLPYVALGLLVWVFIQDTISSSVQLFVREESFIKGTRLPLSVYVFRLTAQSIIRAGYAAVGCAGILLFSQVEVSAGWLWALPAFALIVLIAPAVITIFAFMGAYFPDSQFLVSNVMRLGMFVTPVFWAHTGTDGVRGFLYYWNPFSYFLEIVRTPILTGAFPVGSFEVCIVMLLGCWFVAMLLMGRYRREVVFVL